MQPATSLTWTAILTLALTTGLATALLNQLLGWLRESRKESATVKRDAAYAAMRLAVVLEAFANACNDLIQESEVHEASGGDVGKQHTRLPVLADYPEDIDWKSLDPVLASRALSIRNEIGISAHTLAFWSETDFSALFAEVQTEAGSCGLMAWEIARDLRKRYALPDFNPTFREWSLVGTLKRMHDRKHAAGS